MKQNVKQVNNLRVQHMKDKLKISFVGNSIYLWLPLSFNYYTEWLKLEYNLNPPGLEFAQKMFTAKAQILIIFPLCNYIVCESDLLSVAEKQSSDYSSV